MKSDSQTSGDDWSVPGNADDAMAVLSQPAGTTIQIVRSDDAVSITVPPVVLWRSSLFPMGLLWCVIVAVITVVFVPVIWNAKPDASVWILPLVVSIFWLVGIGLLLGGINMGLRQAGLAVAGGTLMVMQTGPFGKKQREWPREQIAPSGVGPTGMTVNDKPVLELQIHDSDGERLGLLAGRSDDELAWLAHELRQAAKLPPSK